MTSNTCRDFKTLLIWRRELKGRQLWHINTYPLDRDLSIVYMALFTLWKTGPGKIFNCWLNVGMLQGRCIKSHFVLKVKELRTLACRSWHSSFCTIIWYQSAWQSLLRYSPIFKVEILLTNCGTFLLILLLRTFDDFLCSLGNVLGCKEKLGVDHCNCKLI